MLTTMSNNLQIFTPIRYTQRTVGRYHKTEKNNCIFLTKATEVATLYIYKKKSISTLLRPLRTKMQCSEIVVDSFFGRKKMCFSLFRCMFFFYLQHYLVTCHLKDFCSVLTHAMHTWHFACSSLTHSHNILQSESFIFCVWRIHTSYFGAYLII